jgi:hypothetical protein
MDPGAEARTLWIDPAVPDHWGRLAVSGLRVGTSSLVVEARGGEVDVRVSGDLEIRRECRPPQGDVFAVA